MKFIADLHIHSKFSRATSKNLDLENLYIAAQLKGIDVLATGDITHPGWFDEISRKLVPSCAGLFKLREDLAEICDQQVPLSCRRDVHFILESEISSIYKKDGKTRKNHNLVFLPDLDAAARFNSKLDSIGNIKSDGRPILGLDARNLLEILLETSETAFLIPAHIWTPWFSMLGSKSGFDSPKECFSDLSSHIFAAETGLSSDPPMNWQVSSLDNLTLVSNSDAHSAMNLGREANLFDTDLSFNAIRKALETGDNERFLGTLEFYPQEGKYHLDGHRKCGVCADPQRSLELDGLCPECGKPMTLGVLNRVMELSDRPAGIKPERHHPFYSIIPLAEILSEIFRVGSKSKKVQKNYQMAIEHLGSEFDILHNLALKSLENSPVPLLAEAVKRMRKGAVKAVSGFDGEYGRVSVFEEGEVEALMGQGTLFSIPASGMANIKKASKGKAVSQKKTPKKKSEKPVPKPTVKPAWKVILNEEQQRVVLHRKGPLVIIAGPGTGKTSTLTARVVHLIKDRKVSSHNILAVTFTNKAAEEMNRRITSAISINEALPPAFTFHGLCLRLLRDIDVFRSFSLISDQDQIQVVIDAMKICQSNRSPIKPVEMLEMIARAKQVIAGPCDDLSSVCSRYGNDEIYFAAVYKQYNQILLTDKCWDYEDLIFNVVTLLETDEVYCQACTDRFKYIFVDEYQDLNHGQYRLIRALSPPGKDICVIGDPDQSIYSFRGSSPAYFQTFMDDYPGAESISLVRNYRSSQTILDASFQVMGDKSLNDGDAKIYSGINGYKTITLAGVQSERAEAVFIGKTIESLMGGTGMHSDYFNKINDDDSNKGPKGSYGFSDFAILYRTRAQGKVFSEAFEQAGIPCQMISKKNYPGIKGISSLLGLLNIAWDRGEFSDLEKIVHLGIPLKRGTFEGFKLWAYEKGFSLSMALTSIDTLDGPHGGTARQIERIIGDIRAIRTPSMDLAQTLGALSQSEFIREEIEKDPMAVETLARLLKISTEYKRDIIGFTASLALHEDEDTYDARVEKVALMTIHAAKGLEFPVVFIAGCEEDYLPFRRSGDTCDDGDEERRLFFVAMTRAGERLYLTWAKNRIIYGKMVKRQISPFVAHVEKKLLSRVQPVAKRKKIVQVQLELF